MKYIFTIILLWLLSSCNDSHVPMRNFGNDMSTVKHEGCEYVVVQTPNGVGVVHKANCPNH